MSTSALLFAVKRSKLPLPPGPRKLPIVGNLFDVPETLQWETYARWSKEYNSSIIHLDLAGKSMIVINSRDAAESLLEKRSSIYSDREDFPMVNDLTGWDFVFGDEWRIQRRLFEQSFSVNASSKLEPQQCLASGDLLKWMLSDPEDCIEHFKQMTGEFVMSLAYGIDVQPSNDPYVTLAHDAIGTLGIAAIPGRYLVDSFPILKHVPSWFPGAGFKWQAHEWRKLARGMMELPFAETKRQMELGIARSSFTSDNLDVLKDADAGQAFFQERHVVSTAGTMYVGATHTTVSTLATFILAMLASPEAQKKAQLEIDAVTGGEALPTFQDRDSLPYISAIVKEVLRWKNAAPFAVPHRLTVEDEYLGYRLPAGSIVIGNAWALLHDESVYPDPHAFKPERFLLSGQLNPAIPDPEAAFGFGRRMCPGRHAATSSIWIAVAYMLATFDIQKAVDSDGQIIEPTYEYVSGLVNTPVPFKCSIKPRSPQAIALIRASGSQ
ncbi:cytochrome P450 [Roridomyces roridus]|uniref:Cytochrome P450 n=1 Tax=Roridomyces roridus TaxID=1738132 RepID=A0AAD7FLE6_9AGAR|nr:cytochrome P450 [Roridomyces roridus]